MGWRYLLFILGALTLVLSLIRFFAFNLLESPRFLVGIGRDKGAVDVIHQIAAYNSTTSALVIEDLTRIDEKHVNDEGAAIRPLLSKTSIFTTTHLKALFATRKMAISTSLLIALWGKSLFLLLARIPIPRCRDHWTCVDSLQQFPPISVRHHVHSGVVLD